MKTTDFKYVCGPLDAPSVWEWMNKRGGIRIWHSQNLSDLSKTYTTPFYNRDGTERTDPPHWSAPTPGERIIRHEDVGVSIDKEVKRFRVATRRAGFGWKCRDASSRKIREQVAKAGVGAYHCFDYDTQEAVIMAPRMVIPFPEYAKQNGFKL